MLSAQRDRIQSLRRRLDNMSPLTEVDVQTQLFVTPDPVCKQLTDLADITDTDFILEPSAGTGAILRAVRKTAPLARCDAVEKKASLAGHLRTSFPEVNIWCGDFLEYQPGIRYSKIIMNPPFNRGEDIKHILQALTLLTPGGVLAAICLNGPRQEKKLKPLSDFWKPLPPGTFTYTNVSTAVLRIKN